MLSKGDITIIANTTGHYAVNANPAGRHRTSLGGLITLKSKSGAVVLTALVPGTKGLAIQANADGAAARAATSSCRPAARGQRERGLQG